MIKTFVKYNILFLAVVLSAILIAFPFLNVFEGVSAREVEESKKHFNTEKVSKRLSSSKIKTRKDSKWGFKYTSVELRLYAQDYYWGKFINAKAAASEINTIPAMENGQKVAIIGNGYLRLRKSSGFIKPGKGYYYASGVCWTVTTFGEVMDAANKKFKKDYGEVLFVFGKNDRWAHRRKYKTYAQSNGGYGYAVIIGGEYGTYDYTFQINPKLNSKMKFWGLETKIVIEGVENHSWAYRGQAIRATVYTSRKI